MFRRRRRWVVEEEIGGGWRRWLIEEEIGGGEKIGGGDGRDG